MAAGVSNEGGSIMIRKFLLTGLCLAFLSTATLALAENVYVTKRGKKYHKKTCSLIKNKDVKTLELKDAQEKGYKACRRCFKKKTKDSSKKTKKSGSSKTKEK